MAIFTTIAAAVKLADVLGIDDWLGDLVGGEPGKKVAGQIVDVAKAVTGSGSAEEAIKAIGGNAELAHKLRTSLVKNEHDLKLAALEDLKSARQMYQNTDHKMTDKIADQVIRLNPLFILLLVAANASVILYVENPAVAVAVGNVIGFSIGQLWQERQAVINFFFGSSQGSKDKTKQLNQK